MMDLIEFVKGKISSTSTEEELLYEFVAHELENDLVRKGLWTKALAKAEWDDNKAKSLYVRLRVESLRNELKDIIPHVRSILNAKENLHNLVAQGLTQDDFDYLGNPIRASEYLKKYRCSQKKLEKLISIGQLKSSLVNGVLWVQDRKS